MKVQIKYEEGNKFVVQARSHSIIVEQPKEKGGTDIGMSPLEVFLSSLGSCIAVYAKRYCQDTKIDPAGFTVEVESELAQERPFKFKDIRVKINLNKDIGDRKASFLNFVKNCPVHNTLAGSPNIQISC